MSDAINEYYRYGIKDEDTGTITWGEWQNVGGDYMPVSGGTFTGGYFGTTVEVESTEIDVSKGSVFELDFSDSVELTFTGVPESAASCFSLVVNADENLSSDASITWPENVEWNGKSVPVFEAGKTYVLTFLSGDGGNSWFGSVSISEDVSAAEVETMTEDDINEAWDLA